MIDIPFYIIYGVDSWINNNGEKSKNQYVTRLKHSLLHLNIKINNFTNITSIY